MAAQEFIVTDAISDVIIRKDSFIPEGETTAIEFKKLVVKTNIGGKQFEMSFKLTRDQQQLLSLLDTDTDLSEL